MSTSVTKEYMERKKSVITIMGKAILFASMQFAIGSVEMSSKFSVKNFSKDQVTLQHAADALSDYIVIGAFWTLGTCMMFWGSYGMKGAFINLFANMLIMSWIIISYQRSFEYAKDSGKLDMPKLFRNKTKTAVASEETYKQ